jgi:hypothetical protein
MEHYSRNKIVFRCLLSTEGGVYYECCGKKMKVVENTKQQSRSIIDLVILNETIIAWVIIFALGLFMIVNLAFLTRYPPVFIDESWNANAVWNWLKTGDNFDSMHSGTLDQFGYEWLRWPIIGNAPWKVSFAILGLGLFQLRLVSWIFSGLLLLVTILVGRRTYGMLTGVLAALMLSLSSPFLQASHYGRWDIMLAAAAMLTYWLALNGLEENRWWYHFLSGLVIGLSIDIHQNAILFIFGLGALYIAYYGRNVIRSYGAWLFALGVLLGLGYYVTVFILPNPGAYFRLFSLSLGNTHQAPITTLNPVNLLKSARAEIGRYHFYENNLDFALIGASFAYLAVRRSRYDRLLLVFSLTVLSGFVLLLGNKHDVYAILLYPFFMLLLAESLVSLIRESRGFTRTRVFAGVLLILFLFNSGIHLTRPILANRNYNYYAITDKIKPTIPSGARVVGYPTWWLGLSEYDFRSTLNLTYYHFINGYSLTEGFEKLRPDILIVDSNLRGLLVDDGAYKTNAGFEIYKLPRQEFEDFLSLRGEKVLEFSDPWHGEFAIYAIHWN